MASTVLMLKSRSWIFGLTFSTANSCFANDKIPPSPIVCVPYDTAARHQQLTQGLLQGLPDLAAINEWLKMVLANKRIAVYRIALYLPGRTNNHCWSSKISSGAAKATILWEETTNMRIQTVPNIFLSTHRNGKQFLKPLRSKQTESKNHTHFPES